MHAHIHTDPALDTAAFVQFVELVIELEIVLDEYLSRMPSVWSLEAEKGEEGHRGAAVVSPLPWSRASNLKEVTETVISALNTVRSLPAGDEAGDHSDYEAAAMAGKAGGMASGYPGVALASVPHMRGPPSHFFLHPDMNAPYGAYTDMAPNNMGGMREMPLPPGTAPSSSSYHSVQALDASGGAVRSTPGSELPEGVEIEVARHLSELAQ
jgi:hypothetical protein